MGALQILRKDQQSYYDKALKTMLKSADTYYVEKHFKVGEKVDYDKLRHAQLLEEILCTDNCELIDYIYKKIAGKLEKTKRKNPIKLVKDSEEDEHTTVINNFNVSQVWEKVAW